MPKSAQKCPKVPKSAKKELKWLEKVAPHEKHAKKMSKEGKKGKNKDTSGLIPIKKGQSGSLHPKKGKKGGGSPHKTTVRRVLQDILLKNVIAKVELADVSDKDGVSLMKISRNKRKLPKSVLKTFVENLAWGAIVENNAQDKSLLEKLISHYFKRDALDESDAGTFVINIGNVNMVPGLGHESDFNANVIDLSEYEVENGIGLGENGDLEQNKDEVKGDLTK